MRSKLSPQEIKRIYNWHNLKASEKIEILEGKGFFKENENTFYTISILISILAVILSIYLPNGR